MTASWRLTSQLDGGSQVELGFSKRGILRPMVLYRVALRIDAECNVRTFQVKRKPSDGRTTLVYVDGF